jgi:tetratricopeptide (TPR) repeat protein
VGEDTAVVDELRERLERYPADRYPVQHGTASFHLGLALAEQGRLEEAADSFRAAARLLEALPVERAKALNALGAVLRERGRSDDAAAAFERAARAFAAADLELEQGAALHNLGLVRRDVDALRRARALLDPRRVPAQAASAARELGGLLLERGETAEAAAVLGEALDLAEHAGDPAALGAAANLLGLARLGLGDVTGAVAAFADALAAHPRSVRPAEYAMVKANLALAHEQAGDAPRARLAARQALGVALPPHAVATQTAALLARLGPGDDDLAHVIRSEPKERRQAVLREELVRWVEADADERRSAAAALVRMQAALPEPEARDLAEAWLATLLELPPAAMETLVRTLLDAVPHDEAERFRADVESALARFHTPQLLRVKDAFGWS